MWVETLLAVVAHEWSPVTIASVWNSAGSANSGTKLMMNAVEKIWRTVNAEFTRKPTNGCSERLIDR